MGLQQRDLPFPSSKWVDRAETAAVATRSTPSPSPERHASPPPPGQKSLPARPAVPHLGSPGASFSVPQPPGKRLPMPNAAALRRAPAPGSPGERGAGPVLPRSRATSCEGRRRRADPPPRPARRLRPRGSPAAPGLAAQSGVASSAAAGAGVTAGGAASERGAVALLTPHSGRSGARKEEGGRAGLRQVPRVCATVAGFKRSPARPPTFSLGSSLTQQSLNRGRLAGHLRTETVPALIAPARIVQEGALAPSCGDPRIFLAKQACGQSQPQK